MSSNLPANTNHPLWSESKDQNTCWICGKPTNQIKNVTLSRDKLTGFTGRKVKFNTYYVRIPIYICEDCRKEEEQTSNKVSNIMMIGGCILGVITAVTAFFLLDKEFWTIPVGAILGFIWGLIIGFGVAIVYELYRRNHYMQGKHSIKDHPDIREALEEGYKL